MSARRKPPMPSPAGPQPESRAPRIMAFGRSDGPPLRLRARLVASDAQTLHEGGEAVGLSLGLWACEPTGFVAALEIDAHGAAAAHAIRLDNPDAAIVWAEAAARKAFAADAGTGRPTADSLPRAAALALQRFARACLARRAATEAAAMATRLVQGLNSDIRRRAG